MTIGEIQTYLNEKAPFDTAEPWDNVGLLIGKADDAVTGILVTLDVTVGAINAAKAAGANLIVSHHPVIFSPLKVLSSNSIPYLAATAGIGVISSHTNLDKAAGGVNDTLAALCKLTDVQTTTDGYCRIGTVAGTVDSIGLAKQISDILHTAVRTNGLATAIRRIAVCGGSGGEFIDQLPPDTDAFITGEVKHHEWLTAAQRGITVIEAGHYATEVPVVDTLHDWLADRFPTLNVIAYYDDIPYTTIK